MQHKLLIAGRNQHGNSLSRVWHRGRFVRDCRGTGRKQCRYAARAADAESPNGVMPKCVRNVSCRKPADAIEENGQVLPNLSPARKPPHSDEPAIVDASLRYVAR